MRREAGEGEIWCKSSARSRISRGHGRQKWVRLCEEKSGVDERWLFRSGAGRCRRPTNECRDGGAPETTSDKGTWRLRPITAGIVSSLSALCFDQVAKVAIAGKLQAGRGRYYRDCLCLHWPTAQHRSSRESPAYGANAAVVCFAVGGSRQVCRPGQVSRCCKSPSLLVLVGGIQCRQCPVGAGASGQSLFFSAVSWPVLRLN